MCVLPVHMCVSRAQKSILCYGNEDAVCWALCPLQEQQRALKYTGSKLIFLLVSQEARQFTSLTFFI